MLTYGLLSSVSNELKMIAESSIVCNLRGVQSVFLPYMIVTVLEIQEHINEVYTLSNAMCTHFLVHR